MIKLEGSRMCGMLALTLCLMGGAIHADVSAVDSGEAIVLRNRVVSITIEKARGRISAISHGGHSLLGPRQHGSFTILG